MKRKLIIIQSVLWVIIAFVGYLALSAIMEPIYFKKEKTRRYISVIQKLKDIREAQIAHKAVIGRFAEDFESLIKFVDSGEFVLVEKRDTVFKVYDPIYRIDKKVEKTITDTLGFVPVKDSLFGSSLAYKQMMFVPFSDGKTFEMLAKKIEKSGVKLFVFEAKVLKQHILRDQPIHLVRQEEEALDVKGKYIQVGSVIEGTTNGNWTRVYEGTSTGSSL